MKLFTLYISLFLFLFQSSAIFSTEAPSTLLEFEPFLPSESEPFLAKENETNLKNTLSKFLEMGGSLINLRTTKTVTLLPGDAVYPACSAGFCRSQTLRAILKPYAEKMVLFPPHATRYGFDPYNGQINWHINDSKETNYIDEFSLWADEPKPTRFGFEEFESLRSLYQVSHEELQSITDFYNENYYGPNSQWQNKKGQRRVYMTFDRNTHAILHRLVQTNESLENIIVVHFPLQDLVTHPLPEWNTQPWTAAAYQKFAEILKEYLDLSELE